MQEGFEKLICGQVLSANPTLNVGDTHPAILSTRGSIHTEEQLAPQAEDNTNQVYATVERPFVETTYEPSDFQTFFGAGATAVVKNSEAQLFSLMAYSEETDRLWFQLFNQATALVGGETPIFSFRLYGNSTLADYTRLILDHGFFSHGGIRFSTGLVYGWSSTAATYTAAASTVVETTIIFI